jgi:hypothetical protein
MCMVCGDDEMKLMMVCRYTPYPRESTLLVDDLLIFELR